MGMKEEENEEGVKGGSGIWMKCFRRAPAEDRGVEALEKGRC